MENQGFFQWNGTTHGSAGNYPKEMGSAIFAEGILWGAKVTDKYGLKADGSILTDGSGDGTPRIRVNGSRYNTGLKAGKVLLDTNGKIKTSGYSENYREQQIWRVRRDYNTANLIDDVIIWEVHTHDDTQAQMDTARAQYQHDWVEWPADEGAPYDDVNGDGMYTPATWDEENEVWVGDIPGIPGSGQTIWTVANDLPDEFTDTGIPVSISEGGFGSPPIGMEIQITLWGYDVPDSNPLSNVIYKRIRMIYVGLPGGPDDATLDTVYFTQWSDPDLGTYTDDFAGCDTTLNLGYVYNGNTWDPQFKNDYYSPVPAVGYDFLEGPIVDMGGNPDTLGMTSFIYIAAGSSVGPPDQRNYKQTLRWFNQMEGFLPNPEYPTQEPYIDPLTFKTEKFLLAGDPTSGTGWVDGITLPPGDRRFLMNSGPFTMALGDTQDVVVGLVGGMGVDNLSSINVLKFNDKYVQYAYNQNFIFPIPPLKPHVSAFGGDKEIFLDWGNAYNKNIIENHSSEGISFQGYEIWQLDSLNGDSGTKIATYDPDGRSVYTEKIDPESGLVIPVLLHKSPGNGLRHSIIIRDDHIIGQKLLNDKEYYFGIRAYGYSTNKISNLLGATGKFTRIAITPRNGVSGIDYDKAITTVNTDSLFQLNHYAGTSDGFINVRITNPAKIRGGIYTVTFKEDTIANDGSLLWSMADSSTQEALLSDLPISSIFGNDTIAFFGNNFGFQVRVTSPSNSFKTFLVTAHGGGVQDPPLQGSQDWGNFPTSYTGRVNQSNGRGWFFHGGGGGGTYEDMISRIIRGSGWKYLIPNDFEYRFTYEDDNYAYAAYTTGSLIRVPFEMWNITLGYRLCPWFYDFDGNEKWGLHATDHPGSGGTNDPYTDWTYPRLPADVSEGEAGYQAWLAASITAGGGSPTADGDYLHEDFTRDYWEADSYGPELMGRNVWFVWNLDDLSDSTINVDPDLQKMEKGTVVKIVTNKPILIEDKYSFTINGDLGFALTKGDVNADSSIDVSDVASLVDHILELKILTENKKQYAADYNSDFYINIADGVGIVNKILGIDTEVHDRTRLKYVNPVITLDPVISQVDGSYMLKLDILKGAFSGIEFSLNYSKGKGIVPNSISLDHYAKLANEHFSKEDGSSKFVLMTMDGSTIGNGKQIHITIDHASHNPVDENIVFEISDVVLSSAAGETQPYAIENSTAEFSGVPNEFMLYHSYPNPFNPTTTIPYDIASESFVTITIFDILGREVTTLVNEKKMPGKYQMRWNGKSNSYTQLSSGVYFVRLRAGSFTSLKKITLIK